MEKTKKCETIKPQLSKILRMFDRGDSITYWSKGAYNNYSTVKSLFGSVKMNKSELDNIRREAQLRGWVIELIFKDNNSPSRSYNPLAIPAPSVEDKKHVDKKNGILTTIGSGTRYVINCVDRTLIPIEKARFIGISSRDNLPYWIRTDQDVLDSKVAWPSVFEGEVVPRPTGITEVKKAEQKVATGGCAAPPCTILNF